MAQRISRRDLAEYVGDGLLNQNKQVINELAAFLIETKRTRELELIVRDIYTYLATKGLLVAEVITAHDLTKEAEKTIRDFLHTTAKYDNVEINPRIDKSLIGGVKINTPGETLDTSIKYSLTRLRAQKQ